MDHPKYPVYIPAGSDEGEVTDPLLLKAGVTNKALIEIGGKKIIEYVLEEVDKSDYVDRIFIVGITQEDINYVPQLPVDFVPSKGSRMDTTNNLMSHIEEVYDGTLPKHLMVLSADIPLVKSHMIGDIIEELKETYGERFDDIELFYPLIPKDKLLEKYPFANKRFRKFKEGVYATGDFMIFTPKILRKQKTKEFLEKIMENRKTMVKLLLKFDIFAPIKYMLGWLSAREDIFPFMKDEIDVTIEMMVTDYGEICLDLDYPEDFEIMENILTNSD